MSEHNIVTRRLRRELSRTDATDTEEKMLLEEISHKILDSAYKVHSAIGPGLFEEVYKVCLRHELTKSGLTVFSEVGLLLNFNTTHLRNGILRVANSFSSPRPSRPFG